MRSKWWDFNFIWTSILIRKHKSLSFSLSLSVYLSLCKFPPIHQIFMHQGKTKWGHIVRRRPNASQEESSPALFQSEGGQLPFTPLTSRSSGSHIYDPDLLLCQLMSLAPQILKNLDHLNTQCSAMTSSNFSILTFQ